MKKVLIVGASAWQVPMILKAKELGYYTGVVDYNPKAAGVPYADEYFCESTIDPEGVLRAGAALHADGICTVATDMPMIAVSYACEKLGLAGISRETAIKATNKAEMIKAFKFFGVPHPYFVVIRNGETKVAEDDIPYPCICKPTDNSASRGVIKVSDKNELAKAIAYSKNNGRSGDVIIEEMLTGSEISVEAFAVRGKTYILAITDKLTTGSPYFVEMGHSQPSVFAGTEKEKIVDAAKAAMAAVGITNGPAHIEMMVTKKGPVLIELGARLGGDFITTDLVPLSTGIDMLGATIRAACGENVDITPKFSKASAIRYMETESGVIEKVLGLKEANAVPGVHRAAMLKQTGEEAAEIRNSLDRVGYVIAKGDTACEAVGLCEKAMKLISVEVNK